MDEGKDKPVGRELRSPTRLATDKDLATLRPKLLKEFIGQHELKHNLGVFVEASQKRKLAMDHVLLSGPAGLGKTTLAQIIANELKVNFRATTGPVVSKVGTLAGLLTSLERGDILFIDEIHRLNRNIEEVLYTALEDFRIDVMVGEGPGARTLRLPLPPFTLIAATTRIGLLTKPLRDRFGIQFRLSYYSLKELDEIIQMNASRLALRMSKGACSELAKRSRGTPRIAQRLVKRLADFALVADLTSLSQKDTSAILDKLRVDPIGLDEMDIFYLNCLARRFEGGPAGIETIAAAVSEPSDTLEEVVEPYLMRQGLIKRTHRGRVLTPTGFHYLGIDHRSVSQIALPLGTEPDVSHS